MKLTAKIKLNPTEDQRGMLYQTLTTANAACDRIAAVAWDMQKFSRRAVHDATYYAVREEFGLSAQVAVRCIGKVVDAYKSLKGKQRKFKKLGAIPF